MLEGIKEKATQPIGPLPAFAWVIVIVGGYFGYKFIAGRSGSSTTATTAGTVASGTPVSAAGLANTTDISNLSSQISSLTDKIASAAPIDTAVTGPVKLTPYTYANQTNDTRQQQIANWHSEFLNRGPLANEVNNWDATGLSLDSIRQSIVGSEEALGNKAFYGASSDIRQNQIASWYEELLGRNPTAGEINNWDSSGLSLNDIRQGIVSSKEAQANQIIFGSSPVPLTPLPLFGDNTANPTPTNNPISGSFLASANN